MGRHTFRYAILPHQGVVGEATVRTAAEFNNPICPGHMASSHAVAAQKSLGTLSLSGSPAIILDHIKRGEDDEDISTGGLPTRKGKSVILRFYDSLGGRASTCITTYAQPHPTIFRTILIHLQTLSKFPVKCAYKTNLLEDDMEEVEVEHDEESGKASIKISLRPFEVATYRLQF